MENCAIGGSKSVNKVKIQKEEFGFGVISNSEISAKEGGGGGGCCCCCCCCCCSGGAAQLEER